MAESRTGQASPSWRRLFWNHLSSPSASRSLCLVKHLLRPNHYFTKKGALRKEVAVMRLVADQKGAAGASQVMDGGEVPLKWGSELVPGESL